MLVLPYFVYILSILPPYPTPYPYTTLFRSEVARVHPRLVAEPTADVGRDDLDLVLGDSRDQGVHQAVRVRGLRRRVHREDRKSTRLNSSHSQISYAVFCLKKKIIYTIVDV